MKVPLEGSTEEVTAHTFEDALFFANVSFFQSIKCNDSHDLSKLKKLAKDLTEANLADTGKDVRNLLHGKKAQFPLDLIFYTDIDSLKPPAYIHEGLHWLTAQLTKKEAALMQTAGSA